ncbi:hypothetical protein [Sulfitobacter sp. JB4-11]|uniref:hypothetical protein n=1 Tax=Sulfitobacter rhodophyticola TaxID=3238304 RepID=UPI003D81A125
MTQLTLTKTKIQQGLWQGLITDADGEPQIDVTHLNQPVDGVKLTAGETSGNWALEIPIPADAIADGVQTLIITDRSGGDQLGHITLMAGEVLGDDIRAEMDLLRAELDMLKRAFRRHCLETG